MSVQYRIFASQGLVYVRYEGHLTIAESAEIFANYAQNPEARPGQKQLVDLAAIESFERDYPAIFEMQAEKAKVLAAGKTSSLVVFHAPTEVGLQLARMGVRAWDHVPGIVPRIASGEAEALDILGLKDRSFARFRESLRPTPSKLLDDLTNL